MTKQEIIATRYGEMSDMISCFSVYNGTAKPKSTRRLSDFDLAIQVR